MTVKIIFFKEKNVFVKCHIMSGETILNTCTHTHAQAYVHTNILTIHNLIYTLSNHNSEFIERFPRLKTLYNLHTNIQRCKGGRWCDVLGFVPAGSVSSFSTLQIFREASHCEGCFARQSTCSVVSLHSVCPGQYAHRSFRRRPL